MPMRRFMIARFRFCVPVTALLLVAPVAADEAPAVTIKVRPAVLFAGGDVRTTVRTPRDPRNRGLRVIVEAADYYASSDVQLDGVGAAATHQFTWKDLPGGAYRVEAILLREDGAKETFTSCFAVLSGDDVDTGITAAAAPGAGGRRRRQAPAPPTTPQGSSPSGC
jgi:hypothetical protein